MGLPRDAVASARGYGTFDWMHLKKKRPLTHQAEDLSSTLVQVAAPDSQQRLRQAYALALGACNREGGSTEQQDSSAHGMKDVEGHETN
jgi:hypothetical protein